MGNFGMSVRRFASVAGLKLRKHSPEIMTIAGVVGSVGATVLACKATLKLSDTLDECKARVEEVKEDFSDEKDRDCIEYKKAIAKVTTENAWQIAKLYLPAAGAQIASAALILSAQGIMKKRVAGLAAAYTTLSDMYNAYRNNVRESFGDDVDRDMRYGVKHEIVKETIVDDDGKEHEVDKVVCVVDEEIMSDYCKFFDSSCTGWDKNPEVSLSFLKGVQNFCNRKLQEKGYLFLNDVYKQLGIQPTIAGQVVGWIYDADCPIGDNYVDFGIFDFAKKKNREFVNGLENVILLDFNVDGDILNNPRLKLWSN